MSESGLIPEQVAAKLRDFLSARKTGSVTLDIADGEFKSCKITESVRFDKRKREPIN